MSESTKTLEFKFERTIPAAPGEVFDAWLNPKISCNPWNAADKLLFNPKVDGFFTGPSKGLPITGDLRTLTGRVKFSTPGFHRILCARSRW